MTNTAGHTPGPYQITVQADGHLALWTDHGHKSMADETLIATI